MLQAGHEYDDATFERIFGQIYAAFGSPAPYSVFPDARPFLRWLRGEGIMAGVVTNADCRYRDVVLPALGLNQVGTRQAAALDRRLARAAGSYTLLSSVSD